MSLYHRGLSCSEKIKKELELNALTKDQMMLIKKVRTSLKKEDKDNASAFGLLDASFSIDWRQLKFISHIGSGSFGDTYKGEYFRSAKKSGSNGDTVAIKRIRSGLVDENLFKAFQREVLMLSTVNHKNIVEFYGCKLITRVDASGKLIVILVLLTVLLDRRHDAAATYRARICGGWRSRHAP